MKAQIAKNKLLLSGLLLSTLLPVIAIDRTSQVRAADSSMGETTTGARSDDEEAVRKQADIFQKAFSAGQAKVIADMCTEDCTLTDAQGEKFVGRDAILKLYERCFHEYGLNPAYVNIDSITFPAPDVCLEEGSLFVSKVNSDNRYSVVHVKRNGNWLMMRITESPYNPKPSEAIKDLNWLIGQWTVKGHDKIVHLKVHPIANSNFLLMRFSKSATEGYADELQLIGWSFKTKEIVSWHFGAEGGIGFGHWRRMSPDWAISTKAYCRDGAESLATYKIEQVDNDHFRWLSTNRVVGGEKLPDVPPIEVTRDK